MLCCAAAQQSAAGNAAQPGYDARSEYFTKEEMAELFKPKKKKVRLFPHNSKKAQLPCDLYRVACPWFVCNICTNGSFSLSLCVVESIHMKFWHILCFTMF